MNISLSFAKHLIISSGIKIQILHKGLGLKAIKRLKNINISTSLSLKVNIYWKHDT